MPDWRLTSDLTLANRRLCWLTGVQASMLAAAGAFRWLLVIALLLTASLDLTQGLATDFENMDAWSLIALAGWVSLSGKSARFRGLNT